jgi:hypothetical protein
LCDTETSATAASSSVVALETLFATRIAGRSKLKGQTVRQS